MNLQHQPTFLSHGEARFIWRKHRFGSLQVEPNQSDNRTAAPPNPLMKHLILLKAGWRSGRSGTLPPGVGPLLGVRGQIFSSAQGLSCCEWALWTLRHLVQAHSSYFCPVCWDFVNTPHTLPPFFYNHELCLRLDYSPDNNNTKQEAWKSLQWTASSLDRTLSSDMSSAKLVYCFKLLTGPGGLRSESSRVTVQNVRVSLPVGWEMPLLQTQSAVVGQMSHFY